MTKPVRLLVSAALLGWLAWRTDWTQFAGAFERLNLGMWLGAVAVYALTQFVSALRWQWLARPLGFARPLRDYAGFYFIGMYFNLMLPTSVGGDVVRAWYLDGGSGRRFAAFFSVLLDRGSGLLVLLALACLGTALAPIPLPAWIPWSVWGTAAGAAIGLAVAAALLLFGQRPTVGFRLLKVRDLIRPLLSVRLIAWTTLLSLAVQALNVLVVWTIAVALATPVPASFFWIVVPMVSLLTVLPVSMNGMGIREGGMVLFLAPVGVSPAAALSLALLWFAAFSTASLAGGLVYLFGSFPRPTAAALSPGEVQSNGFVRGHSGQGRAGQPSQVA